MPQFERLLAYQTAGDQEAQSRARARRIENPTRRTPQLSPAQRGRPTLTEFDGVDIEHRRLNASPRTRICEPKARKRQRRDRVSSHYYTFSVNYFCFDDGDLEECYCNAFHGRGGLAQMMTKIVGRPLRRATFQVRNLRQGPKR